MKKILIVIAVIVGAILFLRFVVGGNEDNWICDKGQWITHGKPSYPKPENPCGQKISLPKDKEGCLKIGGVWRKQGPEPFETCNVKAKDRGNICHDNSECQGMCQVNLTKEELSQGMRGKIYSNKKYGQCSVWTIELGCFGMMKQGKAQVICID
jgi:hypothetical protein